MSVIRQPGVLGRTTRRRVVGTTAAISTATLESVAVGLWFWLVADAQTASTALAGLGILFCGALLRAGLFEATVSTLGDLLQPRRLTAAVGFTAGWVVWLLVADTIGGLAGVVVASAVLIGFFVGQFAFERHVFRIDADDVPSTSLLIPAGLLSVGATTLLASSRLIEWTLVSPPMSLEVTTFVIQLEAVHLGIVAFAFCAFLAHQQRFDRLLANGC
ncbi:hypothetical protein [Natronobacterium gregoryi]|uniref:Uncharacterized protein n=2 Tax=Natronobacterium gregoryi TaxID=44930 RepID=L0AN26_NATGS|nr:hypothetical protein [Natronobacterium gregoryi]AFZ74879.1 hypothetical protein Natgr_3778 [Natronobacterium gregoryi SP2]ELY73297.1 hypothetical protein C490_01782 [Natronobacterium gregoryi SP2]PLK19298.1 hypothetical protein CYV19_15575 [Natronobacterium gregoryi SP2]SFJ53292.1 hypothetical protein SAMN05443661_13711 [Natronobacterium gregoryi]